MSLGKIDPSPELWAKWETLLGVFQGGNIAVFSIARFEGYGNRLMITNAPTAPKANADKISANLSVRESSLAL